MGDTEMKHIEVDGLELDIDMAAVTDIKTMRLAAASADNPLKTIEFFDAVLGDCSEMVEEHLSKGGHCSAEDYLAFATRVLEAVGAKN